MNQDIPDDHPRAASLRERHRISEGLDKNIVVKSGLIAHGRGEAYDYLIGERTREPAVRAMQAAVAMLLNANHPVISVNGNIAALVPRELVELSLITGAPLEVNLFYREPGRLEAIETELRNHGAGEILGLDPDHSTTITELSSNRRIVDDRGIKNADIVLVPLEDGDRTEALLREGKKVIAIDLNPLSRTAIKADVTIVDNVTRCLGEMVCIAKEMKEMTTKDLTTNWKSFDNTKNLRQMIQIIAEYLREFAAEKLR